MRVKKILNSSTMYLLMSVLVLVGSASYSKAGGFYVIPVVTEVEVVKEVCTGISVGAKAFELQISDLSTELWVGKVYATTAGKLVKITGTPYQLTHGVDYSKGSAFLVAPSALQDPSEGVKGPFYYLNNGYIAYASYL